MRLSHSLSVEYAELYGVECAILINHFQFWIEQNQAMGRNFHDGRTWMYQTQKEISSVYPYWSEDTIQRLIKKLLDLNILIKGNYNKTAFDKTTWYAFENEKMFTKPRLRGINPNESRNQSQQIAEPIPDTNTNTKPDVKQQQHARAQELNQLSDVPTAAVEETIDYFTPGGKHQSISSSQIYKHFLNKKYKTETIQEAIQRVRKKNEPIGNILSLLDKICEVIEREPQGKPLKEKSSTSHNVPLCTSKGVSGSLYTW